MGYHPRLIKTAAMGSSSLALSRGGNTSLITDTVSLKTVPQGCEEMFCILERMDRFKLLSTLTEAVHKT